MQTLEPEPSGVIHTNQTRAVCMRKMTCEVSLSTNPGNVTVSLRNVQEISSDGRTPRERRFGEPLSGPKNSCRIDHRVSCVCQKSSQHSTSFGKKVQPGIVVGDVVYAEVWKGDTVVADIEELQHLDARRHNANVVFVTKKW